ncbi:MAG: hypothetical protein ACRC6X_07480 [Culicoidibacterales bacterium]
MKKLDTPLKKIDEKEANTNNFIVVTMVIALFFVGLYQGRTPFFVAYIVWAFLAVIILVTCYYFFFIKPEYTKKIFFYSDFLEIIEGNMQQKIPYATITDVKIGRRKMTLVRPKYLIFIYVKQGTPLEIRALSINMNTVSELKKIIGLPNR